MFRPREHGEERLIAFKATELLVSDADLEVRRRVQVGRQMTTEVVRQVSTVVCGG